MVATYNAIEDTNFQLALIFDVCSPGLCDTLNPLEGDKLLSIGGTLAMFPQEPHKVGGCTHNLTQTT